MLESNLREEEIKRAIEELQGDKTPGPDGFTIKFYQQGWGFLKNDFLKIVPDFQDRGFLDWRLNTTQIALLPKIEGIKSVSDYRPISLLSSPYKIIAKVLANRLRMVMSDLISEFQGAGVSGRLIQENILIANELIDSAWRQKRNGILLKLDFYKAFDCVSWKFLSLVMEKMNFGEKWVKWLNTAWSTASFSVLVNGESHGFFKSSRGLRQGDPLSPMLFVLAAEVLTQFAVKLQTQKVLKGFTPSKNGVEIPLLQFADDTLCFVQWGEDMMVNLKGMLTCFQMVSGLQINEAKSVLFDINSGIDHEAVNLIWDCKWSDFPGKYLGMPLGGVFKCALAWEDLLDRIKRKLALWKRQYLCKGGRLILVKSTLASIPVYLMSLLVMPVAVGEEIEKMVRLFLWGTTAGSRKYNLVSYEEVCIPMERGGLSLRRILDFNVALLSKWFWLYIKEKGKLWRTVISQKYGEEKGGFFPKRPTGTIKFSLWRGILRCIDFFKEVSKFNIGGGKSVQFWHHNWLGERALKLQFPNLFHCSRNKMGMVNEFQTCNSEGNLCWDLSLRSRLNEREIEEAAVLSHKLQPIVLTETVDIFQWGEEGKDFTVKDCFRMIVEAKISVQKLGVEGFIKDKVWRRGVPLKVNFFAWLLIRNRVLTDERLNAMGKSLPSKCSLCGNNSETTAHLFLQCKVAKEVWAELLLGSGKMVTAATTIEDIFYRWSSSFSTMEGATYWNLLAHAVCWGLWNARNDICFENEKLQQWQITQRIKKSLWYWGLSDGRVNQIRIEELIFNWREIMYM